MKSVLVVHSKELAARMQGGLCEERPGLPRTGHSTVTAAPTDPPHGTAEPVSQDGHILGKTFKKGQNMTQQCV